MAKLQPKVYIIGLTNGAACSQSAHRSSASKPCSVVAQLAQFFTTDAQRLSVHQERPRPAADDVAACSRASAARSSSQLAGWPALLQPPCRPSRAKRWVRRQTLCRSLISGWRAADRSFRDISEPQPAGGSLSGAPGRPRPVVAAPPGWSQQDGRRFRCP